MWCYYCACTLAHIGQSCVVLLVYIGEGNEQAKPSFGQ